MSATQIPVSIKATVLLVIMTEHTLSFMMPAIMVYMVEKLGGRSSIDVSDFQVLSFWVGMLEGSNRVFSFIGCLVWGAISDKIGRKNSLLITIIGIAFCSLGLGLSYNLWMALTFRIIAGFLAGTIPTLKALIRDVSDDSNISVLYGYFGTGYGAASILGPLIGGLLSNSGQTDFIVFNNSFINTFPYFYPMIAHSSLCFVSFFLVFKNIPQKPVNVGDKKGKYSSFLKSKDYLLSTFIFICIAVVQFSYRSLLALWLALDTSQDGIGWTTEVNPGIMNSLSGVIVMLFSLLFTNKIERKFGIRKGCILIALLLTLPIGIISYGYALSGIWLMVFLIVFNGLSVAFTTILVSVISIAISNSITSDVAGIAIGFTQAFVGLSRGIGNGSTAILFGYLQSEEFGFPFDFHLLFYSIICLLIVIVALIRFALNDNIEKRKTNKIEVQLLEKSK